LVCVTGSIIKYCQDVIFNSEALLQMPSSDTVDKLLCVLSINIFLLISLIQSVCKTILCFG